MPASPTLSPHTTPLGIFLDAGKVARNSRASRRVALFLPSAVRGGTLRLLKHVALMLKQGALEHHEELEVVVSCLHGSYNIPEDFQDLLSAGIKIRPTRWRAVTGADGLKILKTSTSHNVQLRHEGDFSLPEDGHNGFLDCDWWLFITDRVLAPVLPLRPYGVFVTSCLQRYVPESFPTGYGLTEASASIPFLRAANFVMTTTPSTAADLNTYVGVPRGKIEQIPPFIDIDRLKRDESPASSSTSAAAPYFVWLTGVAPHKNHARVIQALAKYYEAGGKLKCVVIGKLTEMLRKTWPTPSLEFAEYVNRIRELLYAHPAVANHLRIAGEVADSDYQRTLQASRFLLTADLNDNGCFGTIDAACLGVPSLCSSYPAQNFIDETFLLNSRRFDPHDPDSLCQGLFEMEANSASRQLPSRKHLESFHWRQMAPRFYNTILTRMQAVHEEFRIAYR